MLNLVGNTEEEQAICVFPQPAEQEGKTQSLHSGEVRQHLDQVININTANEEEIDIQTSWTSRCDTLKSTQHQLSSILAQNA